VPVECVKFNPELRYAQEQLLEALCYGRAWRHIRAAYIAAHPLCEECQRAGRLTPAQEVHHILPLSQGGDHRPENLMALCKPCHSGITIAENNRRRES
jgi:5-methylcytosine-specific restriction protein A